MPLDYARLGRQIALPEIGSVGQQRLADTAVAFTGENFDLAMHLHTRAGGALAERAGVAIAIPVAGPDDAARLASAAWAAVEAARQVLGRPPAPFPDALRAHFAKDGA